MLSKNTNRIAELASIISENTTKIDHYFISNSLPTPSFDIAESTEVNFPENLTVARNAVLDANMELSELLLGPKQTFVEYQVCTFQNHSEYEVF